MPDVEPSESFAPIYVELLRVRNFRGIGECELELEPGLTLLVGRNNAGKSRMLRALAVAMGAVAPELDDLTVGSAVEATIDLVVAPPPPSQSSDDEPFDVAVARRLGPGAAQTVREEPLRERFAWRTTIRRSAEGLGARSEAHLLVFDAADQAWVQPSNASLMSRDQRALFAADLIETRRDVVEELARRGSAIRRVLSDLEVDETTRIDLEDRLALLSTEIVDKSAALHALKTALEDLESLVGSVGRPAIAPLPVRLEELARSVAIELDTGSGALPVRLHGAGTRSLASLQVQGVLYDRRLGRDGPSMRPHPLTLVEEPEAHLHPQASLELAALLGSLKGQVIASTHSPHLVTAVDAKCIRLIRLDGNRTTVFDLGPARTDDDATHRALRPSLHAEEMEKLKRLVERPFGEMLFCSAIVIGDGATERAFLPIVIRHALGGKAHGVCVIDPGSMGNDLANAAVKFAKLVDVPWVLFADSDEAGRAAAEKLVQDHAPGEDKIVWVSTGSQDDADEGAIERMLITFDEELCRAACKQVRPNLDGTGDVLKLMKGLKGSIGALLARRLIDGYPDPSAWPAPLRTLVERLEALL